MRGILNGFRKPIQARDDDFRCGLDYAESLGVVERTGDGARYSVAGRCGVDR